MEECEALCSRLAIIVSGKFKCLGNPGKDPKNKCGSAYILQGKIKTVKQAKEVQKLKIFIETTFPGTKG